MTLSGGSKTCINFTGFGLRLRETSPAGTTALCHLGPVLGMCYTLAIHVVYIADCMLLVFHGDVAS